MGIGREVGKTEKLKVLRVNLRIRVETFKGSDVWDTVVIRKELPTVETAILICDVWDRHWCKSATERVNIIATKINRLIKAARKNGVQIIHSPSETMDFYADTPFRRRIADIPRITPSSQLDLPSPPLPIDDSDGGCDDTPPCKPYRAWTRQHPLIEIMDPDVISDNGLEIYSFMKSRGINNLAIMGVHTNMCILNRPFGIKQMVKWGVRCILVRDLTDAMYNPRRPPYVSHEKGTELVVEYIEKYWCPSILSNDLLKAYSSKSSVRRNMQD
ncbi:MAG: isochorismatase family protein [Candidatus Bathyarchaeia archaeon]